MKEHETITHESHYHNHLRFLNLCWPTILVNSLSFVYSCIEQYFSYTMVQLDNY